MAKTKKSEKEKVSELVEELEHERPGYREEPEREKPRYRFIQACNYSPLGDKRYEVGDEDDLTGWREEHIRAALENGIVERR